MPETRKPTMKNPIKLGLACRERKSEEHRWLKARFRARRKVGVEVLGILIDQANVTAWLQAKGRMKPAEQEKGAIEVVLADCITEQANR